MQAVIVDTGPLVAYFDRDDHDHAGVHAWFARQASKHRLLERVRLIKGIANTETSILLASFR